jgi:hypothetical protein
MPERPAPFVTVVSGYPRSGTSLMMQMLAAGGLEVLVDDCRPADDHNPRGYFEFSPSLMLNAEDPDVSWVPSAAGRAVKVMAYQLQHLPDDHVYRVVFMRRTVAEVLASWDKMGLTRPHCELDRRQRELSFKTEYAVYEARLERRPCMRALFLQYGDVLAEPAAQSARVADFLGLTLDLAAMAGAVDLALYHNRAGG